MTIGPAGRSLAAPRHGGRPAGARKIRSSPGPFGGVVSAAPKCAAPSAPDRSPGLVPDDRRGARTARRASTVRSMAGRRPCPFAGRPAQARDGSCAGAADRRPTARATGIPADSRCRRMPSALRASVRIRRSMCRHGMCSTGAGGFPRRHGVPRGPVGAADAGIRLPPSVRGAERLWERQGPGHPRPPTRELGCRSHPRP